MKKSIVILLIIVFLIIFISLFLFINHNKRLQGKVVNTEIEDKDTSYVKKSACGYYYKSAGICDGTCPAGKCSYESGSCYCKI